jgi:hypothetical protein
MKKDESLLECLLLFAVKCFIAGVAGWFVAQGCIAFYGYILWPTFRFIQMYLAEYGRVTLEVGCALVFIFAFIHIYNSLTKEFSRNLEKTEEIRLELHRDLVVSIRIELISAPSEGAVLSITLRDHNH